MQMLGSMNKKEEKFVATVKEFYDTQGRHSLPWRKTKDPYRVLLSEMMLQQTQVYRVLPKYKAFIAQFPTLQKLSEASLGEVLIAWQGLGYNRRAKMLHNCAEVIVRECGGRFPKEYTQLTALPGIGPYTAGAIMAFAYNQPLPIIETNIRAVYLHHFFDNQTDVDDAKLLNIITATLDSEHPREWYWALMDYGSYIKKEFGNPNDKSKHYTKQSAFEGSDRQIRGAVLRTLAFGKRPHTREEIHKRLSQFEDIRIDVQIENLFREGMVSKVKQGYQLPK